MPNEAIARMRELIDEHEARAPASAPHDEPLTFDELADDWLQHGRTVGDWKPTTARNYASIVSAHLVPAFGGRKVMDISEADVRRWWRSLHDPGRPGGVMSNRNANAVLAALRSLLNWGIAERLIDTNPATGIRKHREGPPDKAPFYTVEEVWALVRAADRLHREMAADPRRRERAAASRHDATIFLVAAFTGLRRGEVISLRWRDMDFTRRSLYVVENVSAGVDARVKDDERRTVPMPTMVAEALARLRFDAARDDDLVFPSTLGRKLDPDALSSRFRLARDAAELRPLRLHEYADVFVMPTSSANAWRGGLIAA